MKTKEVLRKAFEVAIKTYDVGIGTATMSESDAIARANEVAQELNNLKEPVRTWAMRFAECIAAGINDDVARYFQNKMN